eukprot:TRINITY_DN3436_c0_g1_i1.p1 TRINITY_DN3436_c0_g1~~TRINITY_DN3436_c0_g1_i1.p1  ORF type:complete len:284 (-),score=92.62 TRINITY_DN3436_c0_g1_i1:79-930(-)
MEIQPPSFFDKVKGFFTNRYTDVADVHQPENQDERRKTMTLATTELQVIDESARTLDIALIQFRKGLEAFQIKKDIILKERDKLLQQLKALEPQPLKSSKEEEKTEIAEQTEAAVAPAAAETEPITSSSDGQIFNEIELSPKVQAARQDDGVGTGLTPSDSSPAPEKSQEDIKKEKEAKLKVFLYHNLYKVIPSLIETIERRIEDYEDEIFSLESKKFELTQKKRELEMIFHDTNPVQQVEIVGGPDASNAAQMNDMEDGVNVLQMKDIHITEKEAIEPKTAN